MIKALAELRNWLENHGFNPGEVRITLEFPSREKAHLVEDTLIKEIDGSGQIFNGTYRIQKFMGFGLNITGRLR